MTESAEHDVQQIPGEGTGVGKVHEATSVHQRREGADDDRCAHELQEGFEESLFC